MIDPKLNDIPVKKKDEADTLAGSSSSRPDAAERAQGPRQGLSIDDTVASNADLSIGSRGTDTSGVRAGAGAGAGGIYVTPARSGENPRPNVAAPPVGSGTTPISDSAGPGTTNPAAASGSPDLSGQESEEYSARHDEIASHAYRCWHERGCPEGSPEKDWHRAEQELREKGRTPKVSSTTA